MIKLDDVSNCESKDDVDCKLSRDFLIIQIIKRIRSAKNKKWLNVICNLVLICNGAYIIALLVGLHERENISQFENIAVIASSILISLGIIIYYLISGSRFEEGK
jgi:hypothetical protein